MWRWLLGKGTVTVMKGGIIPGLLGNTMLPKVVPVPSSVTQYECGLAFGYNVLLDFIFSVPNPKTCR